MYHSVIGKRLIACVNQREGRERTAREFFEEVYVPLFFGSPRFLQYVNNSPFDQEIGKQKKEHTPALIAKCIQAVHTKVEHGLPDASFFLGGPSSEVDKGMSGQITAMPVPVASEDVYASWIGAAAGLTVQGGLTLLVDADDVLLSIYDGWAKYRELLEQTPLLKPLQVNAWNSHWLAYQFGNTEDYDPNAFLDKEGGIIKTKGWVQLFFAISAHYCDTPTCRLLAYVYSLGQSNTTLGFVQLNLLEISKPYELYRELFTVPPRMQAVDFLSLYDTESSLYAACQRAQIGLRALKPKDVFRAEQSIPKYPSKTDAVKRIAFDTYETWIIAMLNNKDFLARAQELAAALNAFRQQSTNMETGNRRLIEELLSKKNRKDFIEELTTVVSRDPSQWELYERTVSDLLSLSSDNVPLFLTLLRFQYAVVNAKS